MGERGPIRVASLAGLLIITMAIGAGTGAVEADPVLLAVGDIASCTSEGDEATAALVDGLPGIVATLGDHVYEDGTPQQFRECYDPSWGRHKSRTRPAPGNHDYQTDGAAGYFAYFGEAAGEADKGYYSYELGTWQIVALNSNCGQVGGCKEGSPQEQWLRELLRTQPHACTLAYWHHPRFSSGIEHGNSENLQAIWEALYEFGAEVVVVGHEHHYERFAPQDAAGELDPERGIRQFVVGTGGRSHYGFGAPLPTSEVRNDDAFGVLQLTLRAASYDWTFMPVSGASFDDAGAGDCH